jgi:hypothetical protein
MDYLEDLMLFIRKYEWEVGFKPKSRYFSVAYDDLALDITLTVYRRRERMMVSRKLTLLELSSAQLEWRQLVAKTIRDMRKMISGDDVVNIPECKQALDYATIAHSMQLRRFSKKPYIIHPIAAANFLLYYNRKSESCSQPFTGPTVPMLKALICHDLIEDCAISFADLCQVIGSYSAGMVKTLSKTDTYNEQLATATDYEKICKLCDIRDNAKDYLIVASNPAYLEGKLRQANLLKVDHYSYIAVSTLLKLLVIIPKLDVYQSDIQKAFMYDIQVLIKIGDDLAIDDFLHTACHWITKTDPTYSMSIVRSTYQIRKYSKYWATYRDQAFARTESLLGKDHATSLFRGLYEDRV